MLRKIRIVLAVLCIVCITLLFVGIGHDWWGWSAKIQFLPATTRLIGSFTLGNAAVVFGTLLLTWLFGRFYCSVVCPLGVFQDVVIWLRRTLGKKVKPLRKKFNFNKERRWVRYPVLALFIACLIVNAQLLTALLGPYSAYGRMVTAVVGGGPLPFIISAVVTFVVIVVCAWLWGRAWCNTVCPVGTFLGCFSKFAVFGVRVDEDKCVKCGACQHICKASCIDSASRTVDYSRCVDCFDCVDFCKVGAIRFASLHNVSSNESAESTFDHGRPRSQETHPVAAAQANATDSAKPDESKRQFIITTAAVIGAGITAKAQEMKLDGGLAPMEVKTSIEREPRLVPPGSQSVKNFYDKCTACQLCVTACKNGVLRPSTDLDHFLQPQMGYEKGFCRPECTACSEICPTGAILPVQRDAKTIIHIGIAEVNAELCLAAKGEAGCGKCERSCPVGAISMVEVVVKEEQSDDTGGAGGNAPRPLGVQGDSSSTGRRRRPVVAEEICIGCGKCEYLCPSRPVSAITVHGIETHRNG